MYTQGNPIKEYMGWIREIPKLKKEEERYLLTQISMGDAEALKKLIEANLKLVVKIAYKFNKKIIPLEDLVQAGNEGLLKAIKKIEKFDPRKVRFSTYAGDWIKQQITELFPYYDRTIRIPKYLYEKLLTLKKKLRISQNKEGNQGNYELLEGTARYGLFHKTSLDETIDGKGNSKRIV